jgi:hypothetical protein
LDFKFIHYKLQKYTLVTASVLVIFGLLHTQNIYGSAPTFEDKLKRLDAAMDHAVNMCAKDDIYFSVKQSCLDSLEDAWWIDCAEFYDKLDTCKNGKLENFLKDNGRPT